MRKIFVLAAVVLLGDAAPLPAQDEPIVRRITPQVLTPGGLLVVEGEHLTGPGPTATEVRVDGVLVDVLSASPGRLRARLPDSGFRCAPRGDVWVAVRAGDRVAYERHPLEPATAVRLSPGESKRLPPLPSHCLEIAAEGHYLFPVVNVFPHADSLMAGIVRATGSGVLPPSPPGPDTSAAPVQPLAPGGGDEAAEQAEQHAMVLQRNLEVIALQDATGTAPGPRRAPASVPPGRATLAPGGILPLRWAMDTQCRDYAPIDARAVYVSPHVAVLEDVAVPRPGEADSLLDSIGREYDERVRPILVDYFADPAVFDAQLDGDGRILVLFTPRVGTNRGIVNACDFYPQADDPASNQAEVVYVLPPDAGDSIPRWWREIRATIPHEAAHVAAYAARFHRAGQVPFQMTEDSWVMESLSVIAEELFARTFTGARWHGNTGYDQGVACSYPSTEPRCYRVPEGMSRHVERIWDFYLRPEANSPLRDLDDVGEDAAPEDCLRDDPYRRPATLFTNDFSFYGSGWLFLRWAVDHHATDERGFFRALTGEHCLVSTRNLETQAKRPFADLLQDWLIATALDDRPGFVPLDPLHEIPSWNTFEVLTRLSENGRFPLQVTWVSRDEFEEPFVVRGASGRFFEMEVLPGQPRIVEVTASGGDRAAASLRLTVVRTY